MRTLKTCCVFLFCLIFLVGACSGDDKKEDGVIIDGTDVGSTDDAGSSDPDSGRQTDMDTQAPPPPVGAACDETSGCDNGTCITTVPGGYCTAICNADTCPEGSTCFGVEDDLAICFQDCGDGSECRNGYVCDGDNVCVPEPVPVGAACSSDDDCAGGTCLDAFPGGYCTTTCGPQVGGCPIDSTCFGFGQDQSFSACFKDCTDATDCRDDYICDADNSCYVDDPVDPRECSCEFKSCGDDGCGNSCGTCSDSSVCENSVCICDPASTTITLDSSNIDLRSIGALSGAVRWTLSHDSGGFGSYSYLRAHHLGKCEFEVGEAKVCENDGEVTVLKNFSQECLETGTLEMSAYYRLGSEIVACNRTYVVNDGDTVVLPNPQSDPGDTECTFPDL